MIVHPVTGEKLDISSTAGRSVFKNYLKFFNTGGESSNISVKSGNLTAENLSKFLAELNKEFKTKVGSDVDPEKLKEITGIVTGKIDELKGLITDSNFVSKTELDNITGKLDSLTKPPETTGITEDILNTKLKNYFTQDRAKNFAKQLNTKLQNYFTQDEAKALENRLIGSIDAKPSPVESRVSITDEEFKDKLVKTGLFKGSEESKESDGIAFNINKLPKPLTAIDENELDDILETYGLIFRKEIPITPDSKDTETVVNPTINKDRIRRIEKKLELLEEKKPENSGKDEVLKEDIFDALVEQGLLEDDEGKYDLDENIKNAIEYVGERDLTYRDGPLGDKSTGGSNEEKEEDPLDLLGDPLTKNKLKKTIKEINFGKEEEEKTIANIIEELKELKQTTGAESKVDNTEIEELKNKIEPQQNFIMEENTRINSKILDLQKKNTELEDIISVHKKYIDKRNIESKKLKVSFIKKDNTTSEPIDTLQKPLTGTSLRELIDKMQFGPKDNQKTIKTIVEELNNSGDSEIDEKIESIVNSIIDKKTKDIETKILKSIRDKFMNVFRKGIRRTGGDYEIEPNNNIITKVSTVLNSMTGEESAYKRG